MLTPVNLFLKLLLFCTSRLLSRWELMVGCSIRRFVSSPPCLTARSMHFCGCCEWESWACKVMDGVGHPDFWTELGHLSSAMQMLDAGLLGPLKQHCYAFLLLGLHKTRRILKLGCISGSSSASLLVLSQTVNGTFTPGLLAACREQRRGLHSALE